ncbi:MAG: helix-turn-helix transcriptional regulator, partial [Bacteroidota bacterium]
VLTYSSLILCIFLQFICHKRNLESRESILFSISLLSLILAFTLSPFWEGAGESTHTPPFTLFAMIFVGFTTPMNIMAERKHRLSPIWKYLISSIALLLLLSIFVGAYVQLLYIFQYFVVTFLGLSVLFSMLLVRSTSPKHLIAHREQRERMFALAFMFLVPLSLALNYIATVKGMELITGFSLPLIFFLLAIDKVWDDMNRLSLLKPQLQVQEQHYHNYALTQREQEIAQLLSKGNTYKQIAEELFISMATVKTHAHHIYRKCGVNNRNELLALLIS